MLTTILTESQQNNCPFLVTWLGTMQHELNPDITNTSASSHYTMWSNWPVMSTKLEQIQKHRTEQQKMTECDPLSMHDAISQHIQRSNCWIKVWKTVEQCWNPSSVNTECLFRKNKTKDGIPVYEDIDDDITTVDVGHVLSATLRNPLTNLQALCSWGSVGILYGPVSPI